MSRRTKIIACVVIAIVALTIVFTTLAPTYVALGTFDLAIAANIRAKLDQKGFVANRDYRLADEGRTILINSKVRNEVILHLAEEGVLPPSSWTYESENASEYEEKIRTMEALKQELKRIILTRKHVIDFQISVPFVEITSDSEMMEPTAAAVIEFEPGYAPSDTDVATIRRLIVNAFPGLHDRNLTLTDEKMNPLPMKPSTTDIRRMTPDANATPVHGWPGVEYSEARAYLYNLDGDMVSILEDSRIHPSVVNKKGAAVSKALLHRVSEIVARPVSKGLAACYAPRHAIVYFDSRRRPVAFLEVCFECDRHEMSPAVPYQLNDFAFRDVFVGAGLPVIEMVPFTNVSDSYRVLMRGNNL